MSPAPNWKLPNRNVEAQHDLVTELGLNPLISQILINRNILTPEDAKKFLFPSLRDLHNPFLLEDMTAGVERVITAIQTGENIVVFGDYDVDGITSTVILVKFLQDICDHVSYYIPNRLTEGYSLNKEAIAKLKQRETQLIITVDCGTSNHEEIQYAQTLGIDTIVLDHHEVPDALPECVALINPHRKDSAFPFKYLAGVGVTFNFLIALRGSLRNQGFWKNRTYPNLKIYLDLVALGTIGDLVPLLDENRTFAKIGLGIISNGDRIGLRALRFISGLEYSNIDSESAAFKLIPRINAAGRVGSPDEAVRLLLTDDFNEALVIAEKLDSYNRERQELERVIFSEILQRIDSTADVNKFNSFVFSSPQWHPGVIGIVASRIVERYYRPTILISLKDGIGRGSGRSIAEFNLYEGLDRNCSPLLISYGGHRFAAGISIREENINDFSEIFDEVVNNNIGDKKPVPQTFIDARCTLKDIDYNLLSQIEMLSPFGNMNSEPVLCAENLKVRSHTVVGNNHLRLFIAGNGVDYDSIWFNKANLFNSLDKSMVNLAFTPQFNHWKGGNSIQLKIKDLSIPEAH